MVSAPCCCLDTEVSLVAGHRASLRAFIGLLTLDEFKFDERFGAIVSLKPNASSIAIAAASGITSLSG